MSLVLLGILNSQAAGAGAGAGYELIETQTLASNTATFTFSGIDSLTSYRHLQIRYRGRTISTGPGRDDLDINFNSGTQSGWVSRLERQSTTTFAAREAFNDTSPRIGDLAREDDPAENVLSAGVIDFMDIHNTNVNTAFFHVGYTPWTDSLAYNAWQRAMGSFPYNTTITDINLTPQSSWDAGSVISLYGLG